MALERGTLLNNRYRIVEILGQGGMGAVYQAIDENLGIEVAVKENLFLTDEYARQFRREATILASLRHPNLPRVGDHFEIDHQGQYLVMDYIDGEDLRQRMERVGTIAEEEAVLIGLAMCDALSYLHNRKPPVVHRDIKPGNVKITPEGQIILVDFGLAKVMADSQATSTGARAMTPGYSPPEQYGTARTDSRTDIYSLAATLYAAMTGMIPEDGLARATGNAVLTPLRKINGKINRRVAMVLERALAISPDERYQTADEFKTALQDAYNTRAGRQEITITPPPPLQELLEGEVVDGEVQEKPGGIVLSHAPSSRPVYIPRRPWHSGSNWLALFLMILLLGGSAAMVFNQPNIPAVVAAMFQAGSAGIQTNLPPATAGEPSSEVPASYPTSTETPCPLGGCPVFVNNDSTPNPSPSETPSPLVEPSPAVPDLSPTPSLTFTPTAVGGGLGEIAFVSDRTGTSQIWIMDATGSKLTQLTNLPEGACQPAWSPNGNRLVFISPCPGKQDIYERANMYIINRDGSEIQPLPASPEGDFDPTWSPDGTRIAFTSLRNGKPRIFVLNLSDNSIVAISDSPYADKHPAWSPSGSQLAFVRFRNSAEIWVISDSGHSEMKFSVSGTFNDAWPAWSPDGRFIYFSQYKEGGSVPWLMGMRYEDRGNNKEFRVPAVSNGEIGPVAEPSFSPDGFWVVYESWPDGSNHDIYRMTISGASPQRLTTDPGNDYGPVWRPMPKQPPS